MKLTQKKSIKYATGLFIHFGLTLEDKFLVTIKNAPVYRSVIDIKLPASKRASWLDGVFTILQRFLKYYMPIRMEYHNVIQFFTLQQLEALEAGMRLNTIYLHKTPRNLCSSLAAISFEETPPMKHDQILLPGG
jgi:hypothetical protein